jgi:hypothetical protein
LDVFEWFPAGEELEFGEGDGDFGLVVGVAVFLWVLLVQSFGEFEVWVDLQGECFGEGEDLDRLCQSENSLRTTV